MPDKSEIKQIKNVGVMSRNAPGVNLAWAENLIQDFQKLLNAG